MEPINFTAGWRRLLRQLVGAAAGFWLAASAAHAAPPAKPPAKSGAQAGPKEGDPAAGKSPPKAAGKTPAKRTGLKKASTKEAGEAEPPKEKPVPFDRRWLEPYFTTGPFSTAAEAFRREDWRRAVTAFSAALARTPRQSPERAPAQYLLAQANFNLGEWTDAGALFEALYEKWPVLAPYHAYQAARSRLRRGDYEGALVWTEKVPEGAILEAEAILIRLDALAALERPATVAREAARFLERFPNGPRRAEAMYRRAEAMEKTDAPVAEIAALYRRIWAEAPLEAWSRRAEERLEALRAKLASQPAAGKALPNAAEDPTQFTAPEWLSRGLILFDRNQNEDAEAALGKALDASPAGAASLALRCKAEYHRAQSIFKQRQRSRAVPYFVRAEGACREAGDVDLTTKSLYQGGRCLHAALDRGALAKYAAVEKEAPSHSYADDARLRQAELLADLEDKEEAATLLRGLPDLYPRGDQVGEALWRLALAAIREKNFSEANKWLDENLKRIPREEIWYAEGRALYWKARVAISEGDKNGALGFYTRAVREYPLSVYTFLSLERMRTEFPQVRRKLLSELRTNLVGPGSKATWQFEPRPVFGRPEFRRAVELARMGIGNEARRELARLGLSSADTRDSARQTGKEDGKDKEAEAGDDREDVTWITAILLDRGRSWAAAHAIPRYSLTAFRDAYPQGKREAMWRLAYPRAFPEIVPPNSKANRVPEALQWAIMREESAFNPRIESFANALGLTQMLVKTARRFSSRPVSRETLLDPARNVEVGSRFLSFLLERFHRKEPLAIAGYNAGEGAVDRWLGERGDLPLDEFLETIPYDETRNYTKRVLATYLTYAWLYEPTRPVPELSFTLKAAARNERGPGRPAGRHAPRRPRR